MLKDQPQAGRSTASGLAGWVLKRRQPAHFPNKNRRGTCRECRSKTGCLCQFVLGRGAQDRGRAKPIKQPARGLSVRLQWRRTVRKQPWFGEHACRGIGAWWRIWRFKQGKYRGTTILVDCRQSNQGKPQGSPWIFFGGTSGDPADDIVNRLETG